MLFASSDQEIFARGGPTQTKLGGVYEGRADPNSTKSDPTLNSGLVAL